MNVYSQKKDIRIRKKVKRDESNAENYKTLKKDFLEICLLLLYISLLH